MAKKRFPPPPCPSGHVDTRIRARGVRHTAKGQVRRWSCEPRDGSPEHKFTVLVEPVKEVRAVLDAVIAPPLCPLGHDGTQIKRKNTYTTQAGKRQRYLCVSTDGSSHYFSSPLPRSHVTPEVHCEDCGLPTPSNAGSEATARRNTFPMRIVFRTLRDLSLGESYAATSLQALETSGKPTGRVRRAGHNLVSPERDQRAHWHVSVDMMEQYAPFVIDAAFAGIAEEEAQFRAKGWPVVYTADQVSVRRNYKRRGKQSKQALVWVALVVTRSRWSARGSTVERSNRLARVRALPSGTTMAWEVALGELSAPDYLICDGAAEISRAAQSVWGGQTVIVPCIWHAAENITRLITPTKTVLPEKVRDALNWLSRENLAKDGSACVPGWFDDLEAAMSAESLPLDPLWNLRPTYEALLSRSADVAHQHTNPPVPISNAGAEALIQSTVSRITDRRGPMFSNLARTNLLGDLMVAGSNGYLNDEHAFAVTVRASNREHGGWSPPPRALNEPVGAKSLRNPRVLRTLANEPS